MRLTPGLQDWFNTGNQLMNITILKKKRKNSCNHPKGADNTCANLIKEVYKTSTLKTTICY